MKALFFATKTNEVDGHIKAWESAYGSAEIHRFDHRGIRNDWQFIELAENTKPEVMFYIGACEAPGNPKPDTFVQLRKIAPLVNLVSDAADTPWHPVIRGYSRLGCFDLQVSIDGFKEYVDHATITPVDPSWFSGQKMDRDIRCGFSGSTGRFNPRAEIVNSLEWFGGLTVRTRAKTDGYPEHVAFLRRCRMLLNVSYTGSGLSHHIKGRVLEAGWAGCCLLEKEGSPIADWFPDDCYFLYDTPKDAADLIRLLTDRQIEETAFRLAEAVRSQYTPRHIYGGILEKLNVVSAEQKPAA
jgi:hypothetical protein